MAAWIEDWLQRQLRMFEDVLHDLVGPLIIIGLVLLPFAIVFGFWSSLRGIWRRRERGVSLLSLLEIGLQQGRTPEQTFLSLAARRVTDMGPLFESVVQRMKAGVPLTDKDREQWLRSLAARLREAKEAERGVMIACSALKRSYRDILRAQAKDVRFVFLRGERALIAERLAGRRGHYMPASLLESQLDTLEEPSPDENAWVSDIAESPEDLVAALVARASA